jgi:hypothetical protein
VKTDFRNESSRLRPHAHYIRTETEVYVRILGVSSKTALGVVLVCADTAARNNRHNKSVNVSQGNAVAELADTSRMIPDEVIAMLQLT